ncbi:hypothetical protein L249_3815 [Ophiocordyceps polyrhachis-furcata BCC 54312]|uniref:6-phosphogluconolactonase n=1 Tax=Ophiocordyceps polyrhachis-furcata BCC 54312 TaxID=1330021 RepID=A0A367L5Y5_9HYPO|nr:hypothetical protein L249_3815 [Ophiocordyceps polyrhachis-furcata BCC 54312]
MFGPSARYGLVWTALWATVSMGQFLYVSSYDGKVTTLDLGSLSGCVSEAGDAEPVELKTVGTTADCGENPSILHLDDDRSIVYCINEGFSGKGGVAALSIDEKTGFLGSGTLKEGDPGPVFGGLFNGGQRLAVANFGNASISVWDVSNPKQLRITQTERFKLDKPGAIADKQNQAKPHQTLIDPTGKFAVVPDLGADLIRKFAIENDKFKPIGQVEVKAGSGPRHAAFAQPRKGRVRMVLVNELDPRVDLFDVVYGAEGGLDLNLVASVPVHGEGKKAAKEAFPAEVVISPDNKFVIVSSRNENNLKIADFKNGTDIPSDPIISFKLDDDDGGKLVFAQEVPAGGRFPRHFSMSGDGTLLAVGLQKDKRVVIIRRDAKDGTLGTRPVAFADVTGEVTSVIFGE